MESLLKPPPPLPTVAIIQRSEHFKISSVTIKRSDVLTGSFFNSKTGFICKCLPNSKLGDSTEMQNSSVKVSFFLA